MLPNGRCACQSKEAERPAKDVRAPPGCVADEGCCAIAGMVRPSPAAALIWIVTYPPRFFVNVASKELTVFVTLLEPVFAGGPQALVLKELFVRMCKKAELFSRAKNKSPRFDSGPKKQKRQQRGWWQTEVDALLPTRQYTSTVAVCQ